MSRGLLLISQIIWTTLVAPVASLASPGITGPCADHLNRLGYKRVQLESTQGSSSLYEAMRGGDEVKVLVANSHCALQRVWLDD